MKILELNSVKREEKGKNRVKKLRDKNLIPAVIYGGEKERLLAVKLSDADRLYNMRHENFLIKLKIEGDAEVDAIIKNIQLHPVTNKVLHLDFLELVKGKTLTLTVPLEIVGTPAGVKLGGILERFLWDIEIETIPSKIPEKIEVDVSEFQIGDSLHVRDLKVEEGVKITLPEDEVVLTVVAPSKAEEVTEEAAEGEETAEAAAEKKESAESGGADEKK